MKPSALGQETCPVERREVEPGEASSCIVRYGLVRLTCRFSRGGSSSRRRLQADDSYSALPLHTYSL